MVDELMPGMHFGWWIFWIAIIVVVAATFVQSLARQRETPTEILLRRYASGEISTEDYENQLARIRGEHDQHKRQTGPE